MAKEGKMRKALGLLVVAALSIGMLAAQMKPQVKPAGGFEQLKKLVGEWEVKDWRKPFRTRKTTRW